MHVTGAADHTHTHTHICTCTNTYTQTHSHLERKRGPPMPCLGLHIQHACKKKSSHTYSTVQREKHRVMSGVSLLKGSGNFHSRVLLKLPQSTLLKPVLTNLLQNPNYVLIPPRFAPPLPDPSGPYVSFLNPYLPLQSGVRLHLSVSVCG